jgi:hypothetical protein
LDRIIGYMETFSKGLEEVLKSYVKQNTIQRLVDTANYLQDTKFFSDIVSYPEFEKIVYVFASYLERLNSD